MMPNSSKPDDSQDLSTSPQQHNEAENGIPDELRLAIENIKATDLNLESTQLKFDFKLETINFNKYLEPIKLTPFPNLNLTELVRPPKIFLFHHLLSTYSVNLTDNTQLFPQHIWFSIFSMLEIKDLAILMLSCKSIANLMTTDETSQKRFYNAKLSIFHSRPLNPTQRFIDNPRLNLLADIPVSLQIPKVDNFVNDTFSQPGDGTNGFTFRR